MHAQCLLVLGLLEQVKPQEGNQRHGTHFLKRNLKAVLFTDEPDLPVCFAARFDVLKVAAFVSVKPVSQAHRKHREGCVERELPQHLTCSQNDGPQSAPACAHPRGAMPSCLCSRPPQHWSQLHTPPAAWSWILLPLHLTTRHVKHAYATVSTTATSRTSTTPELTHHVRLQAIKQRHCWLLHRVAVLRAEQAKVFRKQGPQRHGIAFGTWQLHTGVVSPHECQGTQYCGSCQQRHCTWKRLLTLTEKSLLNSCLALSALVVLSRLRCSSCLSARQDRNCRGRLT